MTEEVIITDIARIITKYITIQKTLRRNIVVNIKKVNNVDNNEEQQ